MTRRRSPRASFALFALCAAPAAAAPPADVPPVAAAAREQVYTSDALRYMAVLPAGWAALDAGGTLAPAREPAPDDAAGITVRFIPETAPLAYLRGRSSLSPTQRSARGTKSFTATPIKRLGSWSYIETTEADLNPAPLLALEAALGAPGGLYAVTYFARGPRFAAERAAVERFLTSFRRRIPPVTLAAYSDPEWRFTLDAPASPWARSRSAVEGVLRFIGPAGPGPEPPPTMLVRRLAGGSAGGEAFLAAEAQSTAGRKAGQVRTLKLPGGLARVIEVEDRVDTAAMPEARGHREALRFRTSHAVFPREDGSYVLSYQAPPATYADFLPAFKKALASFRVE